MKHIRISAELARSLSIMSILMCFAFAIAVLVPVFESGVITEGVDTTPKLLPILQEELKPWGIPQYNKLEASIAREFVRLQCPHP